jgi:hypothetical protein
MACLPTSTGKMAAVARVGQKGYLGLRTAGNLANERLGEGEAYDDSRKMCRCYVGGLYWFLGALGFGDFRYS